MRALLLIICQTLISIQVLSQSPNWPLIKNSAKPLVHDTAEYGIPYIQPHHNLGWEDGMFMSRDGLKMYAFYLPADLILFSNYLSINPICPPIYQYIRGPLLGVDTITNPFGCSSLLHSDIIYATRTDTSLPFVNWQPSNLANPVEFEGGAQSIANPDGSLEFFIYSISSNSQTDLYWFRDTIDNPTGPGIQMPAPVNSPTFYEDNPHLERINDSTLVLFLDDHADPAFDANIYYTVSNDDGITWYPKTFLSSVNTAFEDIQPHLWSDGNDWWLYFVTADTADSFNRLSIFRMKQSISGDWNSWTNKELVISPGVIGNNSGFPAAVGEPTLTSWGDISFVLAIQANGTTDTTDQFELDPWYLPRKNPIFTNAEAEKHKEDMIHVFPNPALKDINISASEKGTLSVYNIFGKKVSIDVELTKGTNKIHLNLPPQLYIFIVENETDIIYKKVIFK